jgi:hypothetical protein
MGPVVPHPVGKIIFSYYFTCLIFAAVLLFAYQERLRVMAL